MIPQSVILTNTKLLDTAQLLSKKGQTLKTENNLFCLKIDDAYIHQLFPLLNDEKIKKPSYFGENAIGAHITIIYPEEDQKISADDLQNEHHFSVKQLAAAEIAQKTYVVLYVEAPSLLQLRKKYKLPDLLCFKGYSVGFHITIGVIHRS